MRRLVELRLSRCPGPTVSISYRMQIFSHRASCWAASYFSLQYSFARSPQPTSRTPPSPHTAHQPGAGPNGPAFDRWRVDSFDSFDKQMSWVVGIGKKQAFDHSGRESEPQII